MTIQAKKGLRGLSDISPRVRRVLATELQDAAEEIQYLAQELVPVKTGYLKSTIHVQTFDELSLQVRADAEYAAFVEYGTDKQAAQPFLTPAVEAIFPGLERKIAAAIREEIG